MSEKSSIRKEIKAKIASLGEGQKAVKSKEIAARLSASPEYLSARSVFFYHSMPDEPDTHALIDAALAVGKQVFLPRIEGEKMHLVPYKAGDALGINRYGIEEPVGEVATLSPDLAVIPLLAFDRDKHRLGRGKGYYDRFLACFKGVAVALAFSEQEVPVLPTEEHDVSPAKIVTDREVIE